MGIANITNNILTDSGVLTSSLPSGSGVTNELTYWTSSSVVSSLTTATYPSLTELSYVKGVTSSIQTQLNAKQDILTNPVTGTGTTNYLPKWTSGSAIGNSMVYDSGTNVGIGTNTPGSSYNELLQLLKVDVSRVNITHTNIIGNRQSDILFTEGTTNQFQIGTILGNGTYSDQIWIRGNANVPMTFYTNSIERLRITSDGNILLNSTTDNGNRLQVTGNGYFSGSVGIGTSTPARPLDVNGTVRIADGSSIEFGGITTAISGTSASNALLFYTSSAERMRLDASGNLGLGVIPSAWNASSKILQIGIDGTLVIENYAGIALNITQNAYRPLGTTDYYYTTNGSASNYYQYNGGHGWYNSSSGTAGSLVTFTQSMTLPASGNLLIGTTVDAGQRLQVNGAGKFVGNVTTNGNFVLASAGAKIDFDNPLRYILPASSGDFFRISQNAFASGIQIGFDNNTAFTSALAIIPSGAATFSSSVTAGGQLSVSYANARATITSTTVTNASYMVFANNTNGYIGLDNSLGTDFGNGAYSLNLLNGGAYNLNLGTSNITRATITGGGNFLIGTTVDSGYKLDVNGTVRTGNLYFSTNSARIYSGAVDFAINNSTNTINMLLLNNSTGAATFSNSVTAASLIKSGGTSAQILAADGSVITAGTNITISGGTISASGGGGSMAIGGAITSATAGSVLFAGTSGVLQQDNSNFFWDDTNNWLGVNTNAPLTPLHVVTPSWTTTVRGIFTEQLTNDTNGASIAFGKKRITAAVVNGDAIANMFFHGWDGTSYVNAARVRVAIDGVVSAGVMPTAFQIYTGIAGNGTERLSISSAGTSTFSGQVVNTRANSTADGGGQLYLNGLTGNRVDFNTNGIAPPAFTTRSAGTKIVLYPLVTGGSVDYAIGMDSGTMWYSVPQAINTSFFKWYAGTTNILTLNGIGQMTLSTNQNAQTLFTVSNTTSGTGSLAGIVITSDASSSSGTIAKRSTTLTSFKILTAKDFYIYNDQIGGGDIAILNDFATGKIKFAAGSSSTAQMTLTSAGRLLLGTTTESTFIFDANGTGRYQDNLLVSKNQNAGTLLSISNTTSGTGSSSSIFFTSDASSGSTQIGKYSTATTPYKTLAAKDAFIYNASTGGDISILNDFATGQIKLAAGGSSTAQVVVKSTGQLQLNNYTSTSAFTGTAVASLSVDASGNVLTTSASVSFTELDIYLIKETYK